MKFDQNIKSLLLSDTQPVNATARKYLLAYFKLLNWKKQKLRLGRIRFSIKMHYIAGVIPYETLEIYYIYQDTSAGGANDLQNWQKFFSWKWDLLHCVAFFVAVRFFWNTLRIYFLNAWSPLLHFSNVTLYNDLNKFFLRELFTSINSSVFVQSYPSNDLFVDIIIDFCTFFGIFL